ncbi:MAG: SDR family NAD(P)-dependent oxidoreductase, partial [Agromyces sp.]
MKAQDKVIVVTGAGAGMGREVTLELLRRGAKAVAAVDIHQAALDETVALAGMNGSKISTHVVDISNLEQVQALPAAVQAAHGQVDGLINVAGIIHKFHKVADLSYEEIHRVFNVNFFGTLHMVKEFLPHLVGRPEAQITNISSMGSYVPVPGQTMYGASKAGVKLFTEGLRSELAGTGVGVNLVFPGAIGTNIAANSGAMTDEEAKKMASNPEAAKYKTMAPAVA